MNKQKEAAEGFLFLFGVACVAIGFIGSCLISLWALAIFIATFFGMACVMADLLSVSGAFNTPQKDKQLRINERYCYSRPKGKNKKFKNGGMKF